MRKSRFSSSRHGCVALRAALAQRWPDAFSRLGDAFLTWLPAEALPDPYLVAFSDEAAACIGLVPTVQDEPGFAALFSGNEAAAAAPCTAYAAVYSGHQFGVWAGQLGDGRALGLGEVPVRQEAADRRYQGSSSDEAETRAVPRWEVQLKGSGRTPYSRRGDGRAVLRSTIREFLCSEAMAALGIPTTRALCVVGSPQPVWRETIESAAVLTRLAPSFVRFGHCEYFAARQRPDLLHKLTDHLIDRFRPHCRTADVPVLALFQCAVRDTAELIAQWQSVGFCHGVMNTDNMSMLGLTLDYGPFGFLDAFDRNHICNHSDPQGRYAYRMQPSVAHWNLSRLAHALLPLIVATHPGGEAAALRDTQDALDTFETTCAIAQTARWRAKLGLLEALPEDGTLIERLFDLMQADAADFTLVFRRLAQLAGDDTGNKAPRERNAASTPPGRGVRDLFVDRAAFDAWARDYRARLNRETRYDDAARAAAMNRVNPKYVLRNHLAEQAIRRAQQADFSEVARLLALLRKPYDEQPEHEAYAALPPDWARHLEICCSS